MFNVLVIGSGRAGKDLHAKVYLHLQQTLRNVNINFLGFVDVNIELALQAVDELGAGQAFHSIEDAYSSSTCIDLVSICTSADSHAAIALECIARGSHVLIEKPFTSTKEEAEQVLRSAIKANVKVQVVHNHRCYPGVIALADYCNSGAIGRILHIDRHMHFLADTVSMMDSNHWSHSIPGGRLFEANPHNLYLLYSLIGVLELQDLVAWKRSSKFPHACIDGFSARLISKTSSTVSINMSLELETSDLQQRHAPNFFQIIGTKGTILANYHAFRHYNEIFAPTRRLRLPAFLKSRTPVRPGDSSGHSYFIENYILSLTGGDACSLPSSLEEIIFTQDMNLLMGNKVVDLVDGNNLISCS